MNPTKNILAAFVLILMLAGGLVHAHWDGSRSRRSMSPEGGTYSNLFDAAQRESIRESLKRTVELIRNRGLSIGVNITVKDMAGGIGIPEEVLYAILNDEKDMPQGDLSYELQLAYKDLLKNIEKVEIIEDINMIKNHTLSEKE